MHCKDTILRTQNNWPYSKLIPNSGNTCETGIPENIKTDQAWIAETPVGDWFYGPNFVYSSDAVIRYLLEIVARDGAVGVSIPLRPDGSLDEGW